MFTIYYQGNYRFEMKKVRGVWHAKTVKQNQPEIIDQELVKKIGKMIDDRIRHNEKRPSLRSDFCVQIFQKIYGFGTIS